MDEEDCVTIFLSEGAGVEDIVAEMQARGEEPERDAFGHVKIDKINPGAVVRQALCRHGGRRKNPGAKVRLLRALGQGQQGRPGTDQEDVHGSGEERLAGVRGVIGHDEEKKGKPMRAIEFPRIKGGKNFDTTQKWFDALLKDIGQPMGKKSGKAGH